ncbi:uncharacterized WD repeat-containing protein alr2800-like [Cydia strobilella]|uniref:uncharacterized WD repeat-containing protein alr2800-like n=1 Tax=Cydia strobilella TaxID=1100964 RepID=UPI0030047234
MSAELGAPALVQALRAHTGEVSCCAAHGARLATGGGSALRLWQWRAGAGWALAGEARAAHRFGVTCARWAPSGALLASCGVDGALRVWCGRRLAARRLLVAGGAAAARALCWAGGLLLAGHDDGSVRVWAVGPARLLARLQPLEGAVHALCAPARHALLLVACTEGVLRVFDLDEVCRGGTEQGAGPAPLLAECGAHDLGALSAAHSEDGAIAATGGHDAAVRLWWVQGRGRERRVVAGARLEGHTAAVTALAFARGVLASASLDRTARLWAPAVPACLHVLHAHPRYLTCLALAHDLSYLVTGSNDKSIRMWGLRGLSLEEELVLPCDGLAHFALGDLQGISQLDDDELVELDGVQEKEGEGEEGGERAGGARLSWRGRVHAGAVNCVVAQGDLLATASSDGLVKVLRCASGALEELHVLDAHQYPAQTAAWGQGVLLSGGLDGQAVLWDTQAGCRLRTLSLGASVGGGDAGGGGVRGAAVSPHRPPLLLLATDDGLAPVWGLDDGPKPIHVYLVGEAAGAAWCVSWAPGGAAAALGGAGGELRVLAPPPPYDQPRQLALVPDAHDLGVTSCEFAPSASAVGLDAEVAGVLRLVLATAGGDSLIKLWIVDLDVETEGGSARLQLARLVGAHGSAAARACWGGGSLLASAGADDWARVWAPDGAGLAAVPAATAGAVDTALSAALVREDDELYIAFGTLQANISCLYLWLQGQVALWRLPAGLEGAGDESEEEALDARWWGAAGVRHWLQEHVTRVPGHLWDSEAETALLAAARGAELTGARLLDDLLPDLMRALDYDSADSDLDEDEDLALESEAEDEPPRARLRRELRWLRRGPPDPAAEESAPHALLCPLSHRLLRAPARAADGLTYERGAAHEWFLAAEGAVSSVSGRRLGSARLLPNYGVRRTLRRHLRTARAKPDPDPAPENVDTADLLGLGE